MVTFPKNSEPGSTFFKKNRLAAPSRVVFLKKTRVFLNFLTLVSYINKGGDALEQGKSIFILSGIRSVFASGRSRYPMVVSANKGRVPF